MSYVLLGCRFLMALVLVASVVGKVRGRQAYAGFVMATRRLAPGWVTRWVPAPVLAAGVLAAEAIALVLLALPGMDAWGLRLSALLAATFSLAIGAALRRGDRGPCHCFGASTRPISGAHLARNVLLVAVGVLGLVAGVRAGGPLDPAGGLIAGVAAAVVATLVVAADDLVDLFRSPVPLESRHTMNRANLRHLK